MATESKMKDAQDHSQSNQARISRRTLLAALGVLVITGGVVGGFLYYPKPLIYTGHSDRVNALAWSPDGKKIASVSDDGTMQVWNAFTGERIFTYRNPVRDSIYEENSATLDVVAWSPDGRLIAVGSQEDTAVRIVNAGTGRDAFLCHATSYLRAVAWSPNGKYIAAGEVVDDNHQGHEVEVFDAADGRLIFAYKGHSIDVQAVAWSPDSTRVVSGSGDETTQAWDATTGANVVVYHHVFVPSKYDPRGEYDEPWCVAWSPDGKYIASGYFNTGSVQIWNASTGKLLLNFQGSEEPIFTVDWSPDGKLIVSAGAGFVPKVWDAMTGRVIYTYEGHTYPDGYYTVRSAKWSPDGKFIASASADKTVQVWQLP